MDGIPYGTGGGSWYITAPKCVFLTDIEGWTVLPGYGGMALMGYCGPYGMNGGARIANNIDCSCAVGEGMRGGGVDIRWFMASGVIWRAGDVWTVADGN